MKRFKKRPVEISFVPSVPVAGIRTFFKAGDAFHGHVMMVSISRGLATILTLSLPLYFQLPSTFLPSKGKSITTLGARWHDFFFIRLFRCFLLTLF